MKGIFNFSFGDSTDMLLLNQESFSSKYQLKTKTCLIMEDDIPPVHVSATSTVKLKQVVERKKITTRFSIPELSSESDHDVTNKTLQQLQIFTKIDPVIEVRRDEAGVIKGIANMPEIWEKWEQWKDTSLPETFPDERMRKEIIKSYEKGLNLLEETFDRNMQYLLLLPECYKFTKDEEHEDFGSAKTFNSRFVEKMELLYRFFKKTFSDEDPIVKIQLGTLSDVEDQEDILNSYYELYYPDYSSKDYIFDINVDYTFDKYTSEIIMGKLSLIEQLHPNFIFTIEMELTKQENV